MAPRRKPNRPAAAPARPRGAGATVTWWRLALVAAAGLVVYWNSFGNPFVFDDHATLAANPHIRSFSTMFQTDKGSALTGRPVVAFTFAVNYAIGGLNIAGYRIVNIGLHVLCGLLMFGIVRRTLERPALRPRWGEVAGGVALAVALLWTVHPLNTEVVDYLTQRTEALMGVFYLLTLYASVRAIGGVRAGAWQATAIAACGMGMLCKESMATAPIVVVLYDAVFGFDSLRDALRRRWRFYAGLAATWILVIASVATASRELSGGYATTHVSAWSYLLNQTVVITHYLRLAVWPQALVAYYGWSLPATVAAVWPYAVFVVTAFAASVAAVVRWPRIGFLAAWFFITLGPTSSFLPVAAEVGADRRMYVPLMGLVVLAVVLGRLVVERVGAKSIGVALVAVAAVGFSARTITRNQDYASELRLSQTTLEAWPSGVAHDMVGLSLVALGRREEALPELRQAVVDYPPARYDLGAQLFALGRVDEAVPELQQFVQMEPGMFAASAARTLLGRAFLAQQRLPEAIEQFTRAVAGATPDPQAHAFLGEALLDQQKYAEAADHYRAYLAAYPADTRAMGNLGIALASANRVDEAAAVFRRAAELDPSNGGAQENLARMLLQTGQAAAALPAAQQAVALAAGSPTAHDLLGQALVAARRYDDARREFEIALQIDPGFTEAREHLKMVKK